MIAFASVDLPDPFGPIIAWTLPLSTVRSRPLRISRSAAVTCRFLISSCAIRLRSGALSRDRRLFAVALGELHELGEGRAVERLEHAALHAHPEEPRGAGASGVALVRARDALGRQRPEAVHRRNRALERDDDLVHR